MSLTRPRLALLVALPLLALGACGKPASPGQPVAQPAAIGSSHMSATEQPTQQAAAPQPVVPAASAPGASVPGASAPASAADAPSGPSAPAVSPAAPAPAAPAPAVSTPAAPAPAPASAPAAPANPTPPAGPVYNAGSADIAFVSPSGNITCTVLGAEARCDIEQATFNPGPAPAECPSTGWGKSFTIVGGQAKMGCVGDYLLELAKVGQDTTTWLPADGPTLAKGGTTVAVLAYGATIRTGTIECTSQESGVSCQDTTTQRGFVLSKAAYQLR